jgi:hypothetical protein
VEARRSGTGEPREPPTLLTRASAPATAELKAPPESVPAVTAAVLSSSSSSSSSTPAGPLVITRTVLDRQTQQKNLKDVFLFKTSRKDVFDFYKKK